MKRIFGACAIIGALLTLGGCIYGPGYYQRPGVVYDDGTAIYSDAGAYDYGYGYAPGYYSNYGCCDAGPWLGLGFYGNYYYGGNYYRGYRGSWRGRDGHHGHGDWHGGGSHDHGGWHGSSESGGVRAPSPSSSGRPGGRVHRQ